MQVFIHKNNQQLGPYEEKTVLEMVGIGLYSPNDLAFREGGTQWQPLTVMFPNLSQNLWTTNADSNNQQNVSNQAVVDWAKRNLLKNVEIEARYNSLFSKIIVILGYSIMGIGFLILPCVFLYGAIANFVTKGWGENVTAPLFCSGFLFLVLGTLFLSVICLPLMTRRKIAKVLNSEGVETRSGQKYIWENLQLLNYKKVNTRVRGNLAATAAQSALFAGVEKVSIEMVFADGTATIPPLIVNQKEVLNLLETIPVQRNYD